MTKQEMLKMASPCREVGCSRSTNEIGRCFPFAADSICTLFSSIYFYTLKKKIASTLHSHLSSICNSLPLGHHTFLLWCYHIREPNMFFPLAFRTRGSQTLSKAGWKTIREVKERSDWLMAFNRTGPLKKSLHLLWKEC